MNKQILLGLLVSMCLWFASCGDATAPIPGSFDDLTLPPLDIPWTSQQSIVCFGTSLTYGFIWEKIDVVPTGRTDTSGLEIMHSKTLIPMSTTNFPSYAYPALLGATLKIKVYNQGYVGATTEQALKLVNDSVLTKKPALVLLEFGANDLFQNLDTAVTGSRLSQLIQALHNGGSKVVLVSFLYKDMIDSIPSNHYLANKKEIGNAYLHMLKRVASVRSIQIIEYAMRGIYWRNDLMSDVIHPNEKGYKIMQENISKALNYTFRRNRMLKE